MQITGLEGKVTVVTGAGRMRSIGRSIAVAMAEAGSDVVVTGTGRDPSRYPKGEREAGWNDIWSVSEEISGMGRRSLAVVSDVTDAGAVDELAEQTIREMGRVDFIINNAGPSRGDDRYPIVDVPIAAWLADVNVNLNGPFYMCRAFGRRLIDQRQGGVLINISSIGAKMCLPNNGPYSCSKAGQNALATTLSQELGSHGIRVNTVNPGLIDTSRLDDADRSNWTTEAGAGPSAKAATIGFNWNQYISERIPLGRAGQGMDIAHAVVFLCSDQGSWITGQSINVDGGNFVWG